MRNPELSLVIPVYGSAALLPRLYAQLLEVLPQLPPCEMIFIDDASPDGSAEMLRGLAARDERIRAVLLSRNVGQQEATLCGLSLARGEYIASLDDDCQHPPELLPRMLEALRSEGLDIVYAAPEGRGMPPFRRFGAGMRDLLFRLLFRLPKELRVSSYRVMTAELARRVLAARRGGFNYFSAMVFSAPARARTIPYPFGGRTRAHSGYTLWRRARLYLRILRYYGPLAPKRRPGPEPFPIKEVLHADRES